MDNRQNAKLSSFKLIVAAVKKYLKSVALVPKFKEGADELETIVIEIEEILPKQERDITGVTDDKRDIIAELIDIMYDISGALQSHAHEKSDKTTYNLVVFSDSKLQRMKHNKLNATAGLLVEQVDKLTPEELAKQGISADDVAEFKKLHEELKQNINAPAEAKIDKKGYTERLRILFERGDTIKKKTLDKLASQFKRKDPEFYLSYITASHAVYKKGRRNGNGEETGTTEENLQEPK